MTCVRGKLVRYSRLIGQLSRVHFEEDDEAARGNFSQPLVHRVDVPASILLVEDEDELRSLLRTVLRYNGYSVTEASDCHTALDLLQRQSFNVVLLDITLPDGKGFRVAEAIRQNHLTSKVIVITGTGGLENAMRGASLGVEDFLTKPVHPNYLLRSIEHALSMEHSG